MGGTKDEPTYYNLGDHSETVQVDYNPDVISYEELLAVFFASHDPTARTSCQYKSAVFFHDAEQERLAREAAQAQSESLGEPVKTEIVPATTFTLAEDYHQKYALQSDVMIEEFRAMYPEFAGIVDSTAAARVNAFLYEYGDPELLKREAGTYGLSAESEARLLRALESWAPTPAS